MYNQNMFENHEYFIFHNNSVIKFSVCKVNQEIIIKSDYQIITKLDWIFQTQ